MAVRLQVDASGAVEGSEEVYSWASQGGMLGRLTAGEVEQMREVVRGLPASDPPPPLRNLLIVGFGSGRGWTTRLYDRAKPPPEVVRLCRIVRFRRLSEGLPLR